MNAAPVLLAAEDSNKAGPIGLLVIILLCIACYFLYRSMSRHLRRVREQFPGDGNEPSPSSSPDGTMAATEVDTSTVTTQTDEVVTSTPSEARGRFVPPVRPAPAVPRPSDAVADRADQGDPQA